MKTHTVIAPAPDTLYSMIDGEAVIMSTEAEAYISLNEVGSRIWQLISDRPRSVEELVSRLTGEFDVPVERCRREIGEFFDTLSARGLIVSHPSNK